MNASRVLILCFAAVLILAGAVMSESALADSFMWGGPYISAGSQNWATSIKSQFGGTCWAFGTCGTFESKYMLTRNDTSYQPDLSEEEMCWAGLGNTGGGMEGPALNYLTTHGIVLASAVPYDPNNPNTPSPTDPWPLTSVFPSPDSPSNHYFMGNSCTQYFSGDNNNASIKAALKQYGPLDIALLSTEDLYGNFATLQANYVADNSSTIDHCVELVGYCDCPTSGAGSLSCGGYWVIKNSWGTGEGVDGYDLVPYGDIEAKARAHEENGSVWYTGAMKSVTWTGTGLSGPIWTTAPQAGYRNFSDGLAWVNEETAATFDNTSPGSSHTISIVNQVIAHQLTFTSGASPTYVFNNGSNGGLTVTAGGIQANSNVTINVPITVGAPETWTVASGVTLNATGALHTIISNLTIAGAGNTIIGGPVDGGGIINTVGTAAPGNLIMSGSGVLTLAGASNYPGTITVNSGSLSLSPTAGLTATYTGAISGAGAMQVSNQGTVVLTASNTGLAGAVSVNSGQLTLNNLNAAGTKTVTITGGQLNYNVGGTPTRAFTMSGGVLNQLSGSGTYSGAVTCSGAVEIRNTGGSMTFSNATPISGNMGGGALTINELNNRTITVSGNINVSNNSGVTFSNGTTVLGGAANSWAGNATITNGIVKTNAANNLPSTTSVTLNGGTLNMNGNSQSIAAVTSLVPATDQVTSASACTLTVAPTADTEYAGQINGSVNLVKNGSSAFILSGNNGMTPTVPTVINGGTLQVGNNNNTGTLPGNVTVNAGVLAFNRSDSVSFGGNISGAGGVTKNNANYVILNGTTSYQGPTTVTGGTLELGVNAQSPVLTLGGTNLQMGSIVFDYASPSSDPYTTIQGLLTASYDGGKWDIGQFRDSQAVALGMTLGCLDDTTAQQVTVMATYPGDFNLDGVVDAKDEAIWAANVFTGTTWAQGNAKYAGVTNGLDADLMSASEGQPALGGIVPAGNVTGIPEPATLALLVVALVSLLVYNWKKHN
jgi:autotransporter-associated beta strand protein